MEAEHNRELSTENNGNTLSREMYLTPESIALAAIVDAIDQRVLQKLKQGEEDETD